MPPPNGIQLRKELSKSLDFGHTPFMFLTARSAQLDKYSGLECGADDYITKPFEVEELLIRIHSILRRDEWGYQRGVKETCLALDKLRTSISSNLSHEMRTPLTVLLATLDMVIQERLTQDNNELTHYLQRASTSAYRLKFLIEDLEMLYNIDQGMLNTFHQPVDLKYNLINPVDQVLKSWEHKSLIIKWNFNPGMVIYAPRDNFSHALTHLVDNACKFSPENGEVSISAQPNGIGGCIIELVDQGIGVPLDLREKVFERYYQIDQGDKRLYGGLGIGLTIARAFSQAIGGDVQFLDTPVGCRVRMILPPCRLD